MHVEFDRPIPPDLRALKKGTWWLEEDAELFRKMARLTNITHHVRKDQQNQDAAGASA